jgi:hypothetical protein
MPSDTFAATLPHQQPLTLPAVESAATRPHLPGATELTRQRLRLLEHHLAAVQDERCTTAPKTVAVIAPRGSDLRGIARHLVDLYEQYGEVRWKDISELPLTAASAMRPEGRQQPPGEPQRLGCIVYRDLQHLDETPPIDLVRAWVTARSEAAKSPGAALGILHVESEAAWTQLERSVPELCQLVRHVIPFGVMTPCEVDDLVRWALDERGVEVDDDHLLLPLLAALESSSSLRGYDLAMYAADIVTGHTLRHEGPNVLAGLGPDLGVDLAGVADRGDELDQMIGLRAVARQLDRIVDLGRMTSLAEATGLHCVFTGPPGTGKTTAAKVFAQRLHATGVTRRPTAHVVGRADLIGKYLGYTARLVREACERARGGVLVVDEAYSLYRGDARNDPYGVEAIDTLVALMEELRHELVVVLAGYPAAMQTLLAANDGLASRLAFTVEFPALDATDLTRVLDSMLANHDLRISPTARSRIAEHLAGVAGCPRFGNARGVRTLVAELVAAWASRAAGTGWRTITVDDLPERIVAPATPPAPDTAPAGYL